MESKPDATFSACLTTLLSEKLYILFSKSSIERPFCLNNQFEILSTYLRSSISIYNSVLLQVDNIKASSTSGIPCSFLRIFWDSFLSTASFSLTSSEAVLWLIPIVTKLIPYTTLNK